MIKLIIILGCCVLFKEGVTGFMALVVVVLLIYFAFSSSGMCSCLPLCCRYNYCTYPNC